jgi:serine/threonine-protein kinase
MTVPESPVDSSGEPASPAPPPAETPAPSSPDPPPRRKLRATVFMLGFALLAFVTGVVVFNRLVMPRLVHGTGDVKVPDVTGLTLVHAEQTLEPLGLPLSRAGERFDPSVPSGFVLSQDPEPGTFVRGRRRVSVVVSLGEEFSSVPSLFGESQRSAEVLIRSAGLRLGVITRAPSDDVGEGLVAGSDPGAETVVPRGTPVSLFISTGPTEESYVMPDVMGREIGSVRRQLESAGMRVLSPHGAGSVGTIIAQNPPPGSRITRASTITLQASGRIIP